MSTKPQYAGCLGEGYMRTSALQRTKDTAFVFATPKSGSVSIAV